MIVSANHCSSPGTRGATPQEFSSKEGIDPDLFQALHVPAQALESRIGLHGDRGVALVAASGNQRAQRGDDSNRGPGPFNPDLLAKPLDKPVQHEAVLRSEPLFPAHSDRSEELFKKRLRMG